MSGFSLIDAGEEEMFKGTTILGVRMGDKVALGGDGQVTFGDTMRE